MHLRHLIAVPIALTAVWACPALAQEVRAGDGATGSQPAPIRADGVRGRGGDRHPLPSEPRRASADAGLARYVTDLRDASVNVSAHADLRPVSP